MYMAILDVKLTQSVGKTGELHRTEPPRVWITYMLGPVNLSPSLTLQMVTAVDSLRMLLLGRDESVLRMLLFGRDESHLNTQDKGLAQGELR